MRIAIALLLQFPLQIVDVLRRDAQGRASEDRAQLWESIRTVEEEGFRLELGFIQDMYEAGTLSRAQATKLRDSVYLLQLNAAESHH